ncbi:CUB and sushi domain-containing protein 1-like isoform X1 [Halichondria panicea]|uniref:CUB and sushi domain-containing protein 1-like isoform X1 n=1 Tax=Halichondria panicea TaxID=6063 RepID=UPI00312B91BD
MHEDSMNKLQGGCGCVFWLVFLTGAAQLLLVCGQSLPAAEVYLSLGSTNITTNNTEIPITDIGEDAVGGLPSLICNTVYATCCRSNAENNGNGGLGQWTYPDGRVILNNAGSTTVGEQFYIVRNAPQLIRLARRQSNNPLSPTGSYCCTIPTTGGEMTLCANLVVDCGPPPTIPNGSPGTPTSTTFEGTVSYTCNNRYRMSGSATVTCEASGSWSTKPTCSAAVTAMVCTDLMDLVNGGIVYDMETNDNRPVNTVATYTCDTGYTLNGSSTTRTCGSDGVWSGSDPTCEAIECPPLSAIINGTMISYSPDVTPDYDLGTNATYTCEAGFHLKGNGVRVCMDDDGMDAIGVWSDQEPSCVPIPPPVRSVFFQLRLTNINNCPDWVDQDGRLEIVTNAFAAEVESHCGCGFSSTVITAPRFRCFPGSDRAVTFRATLTDSRLLTPIQDWIQTNGFIPIQNILVEVEKSCQVQVSSLADTECTTNQPVAAAIIDLATVVGGVVGGAVGLILLVGVVVIVIAVLLLKSRRQKMIVHRTTKHDLPPVSLKGVVSTGEIQSYKVMEMGHEYEEVSKFQRAIGGTPPLHTTGSESKYVIKTESSPPTPPTPQPSQATKAAGNDIEFTECVAYSSARPPTVTPHIPQAYELIPNPLYATVDYLHTV